METQSPASENNYYSFVIPNKSILIYQVFAYLIIIINIIFQFFIEQQRPNGGNHSAKIMLYVGVLAFLIVWDYFLYKRKNYFQSLGIIILIVGFRWFQYHMGWVFFVNMALWFLYMIARRRLILTITHELVRYPSYPVKKFHWPEVKNLILKDDIITIDLKNNTVYQHHIQYANEVVNEKEFNEFCRKHLTI